MDCLYLEPEFKGTGIGKSVFEKLKVIAMQNDCINKKGEHIGPPLQFDEFNARTGLTFFKYYYSFRSI